MALERFANTPTPAAPSTPWTTLNGAITSGALSLTVTSASAFPSLAQFRVLIDSEWMLVTAGAGTTTWTVTRGVDGSTPTAHAHGASIFHVLTAAALLRNPRSMTTLGDMEYMAADLGPARLAAPSDGDYVTRWTSGVPSWIVAGGGGTPGGSDTQVQYNDGGVFAGSAGFLFDPISKHAALGIGTIDENIYVTSDSPGREGLNVRNNFTEVSAGSFFQQVVIWGQAFVNPSGVPNGAMSSTAVGGYIDQQGTTDVDHVYAAKFTADQTGVAAINDLVGVSGSTHLYAGSVVNGIYGGYFFSDDQVSLVFTTGIFAYIGPGGNKAWSFSNGLGTAPPQYNGSGTLPESGGLHLATILNGGAGTITTVYGVKIEDQNTGATNYAIYTGTGLVRFGDAVSSVGNITAANLSGTNTGDQTNISGNAGTATALQTARLINGVSFDGTSDITIPGGSGDALVANPLSQFAATTSLQLKDVISDETGSGSLVFATSPTLVTPVLGVATATSINGLTLTASTGIFTLTDGKTLSVAKTLTLDGTDSTTMTFPATTTTIAGLGITQTFTGVNTFGNGTGAPVIVNGAASSNVLVFKQNGTDIGALSTNQGLTLVNARAVAIYAGGSLASPGNWKIQITGGQGVQLSSDMTVMWGSAVSLATMDSGLGRNGAGVVEVNNGTLGTLRDLKMRNVIGQTGYSEMVEMTAPVAGAANTVRLYADDNGAGKTRLMAIFPSGLAQQVAIEP